MTAAPVDPDDDGPGADIVPIRPLDDVDGEVVAEEVELDQPDEDDEGRVSAVRAALARWERPLPTRRQIGMSVRWWAVHGSPELAKLVVWLPLIVLAELRPILRGLGRVAAAFARWIKAVDNAEHVKAAEGNDRAKLGERHEVRKSARTKVALALVTLGVGGGWWLVVAQPGAAMLAGVLLAGVLDLIGRRGVVQAAHEPLMALPTVLSEGVPLGKVTATILEVFDRAGFEEGTVRVASPLRWDPQRSEYRMSLSSPDRIDPEHVRAIERAVGAGSHTARLLGGETAAVRELVLRIGDPLAAVGPPPFLPSHSRCVTELADLGESSGSVPFAVRFAGVHTAIVGKTGSGKTKGAVWAIIDRLSACRNVVIWGIDLQGGPAFPWWREVIQRRVVGDDPDAAGQLLDATIAEITRRLAVLVSIAESDDDADDDEWHSGLGTALYLVIDEFALLAEHDGSKGTLNLLGKVERIVRTGRKAWVHLILATQKSGNSDFGSTTMSTQVGLKILLACDEGDTTRLLSTAYRDSGWAPHLLTPATDDALNDAGKCYVSGPSHRTPDIYRTYAPLRPSEVRQRAKQRIADGLPSLTGAPANTVDAVEVPEVLAAVERAFRDAGNPDRLATAELLEWLRGGGREIDERVLADELRPSGLRPNGRWRPAPNANSIRGYLLSDVQAAIRGIE